MGIGTFHRPLSQTERDLSIGPYLKWIGAYTSTYPKLDRHRSGWKQQNGPRATYFVSPLHQDVAMMCVSREMFTVGVATFLVGWALRNHTHSKITRRLV